MSTLAELIVNCSAELQDTANVTWSTALLTIHIQDALTKLNAINPQRLNAVVASVADTPIYDLSALSAYRITAVWYPWDPASPLYPATPVPFIMLSPSTIMLTKDVPTGTATDQLRIFYTAPHTINGLNSATATTLDAEGERLVRLQATASAGLSRAQYATGRVTVHAWTPRQLLEWSMARTQEADRAFADLRRDLAQLEGGPVALQGV